METKRIKLCQLTKKGPSFEGQINGVLIDISNKVIIDQSPRYEPQIDHILNPSTQTELFEYCCNDAFNDYIEEAFEEASKRLNKHEFLNLLKIKHITLDEDGAEVGIIINAAGYDYVLLRIYFDENFQMIPNQLDIHWD